MQKCAQIAQKAVFRHFSPKEPSSRVWAVRWLWGALYAVWGYIIRLDSRIFFRM